MASAKETPPLGNESFLRAATEGGGWADFHIRCVLYCLLEKRGNTRLNLALNRLNQSFGTSLNASTARIPKRSKSTLSFQWTFPVRIGTALTGKTLATVCSSCTDSLYLLTE